VLFDASSKGSLALVSRGWYTVGVEKWASKDYLNQFFLRPADPEAYDPAKHSKK
jgi:ribose transport system substrate-binding protein